MHSLYRQQVEVSFCLRKILRLPATVAFLILPNLFTCLENPLPALRFPDNRVAEELPGWGGFCGGASRRAAVF